MREWKSRLRIPRFVFPVTVLGLSLLLCGQPSFSDEKRPRQKPAKMLKGDFGRTLIPEVLELKNFQLLPPELFEKYDSRSIAESLVHRIRKSRWEINGTEDFYDLGGPRGRIPFNAETDTALHLYFGSADAENVVRKGFYNIHQRPDLKYTDTRILVRDFAEIRASMLTLAKETTLNADDPVNKLRTKSAILELFLPEGKRPKTMGGVRYGDFVAVFKDEVKRRAMVVPHDSAVIANDFISMEEIRKEVRPLLDFDHLLGTQERLSNTEYYEAMIWGELDIRDVKEFMVKPGSDPALVRPLIDSGLPVYEFVEITEGEEHNRYYKNYQRIRGKMLSPGDPDKMKALEESLKKARTVLGCKERFGGL